MRRSGDGLPVVIGLLMNDVHCGPRAAARGSVLLSGTGNTVPVSARVTVARMPRGAAREM